MEAVDKGERYRNDEASDGEGVKEIGGPSGAVASVELGIDVLGDGIRRRAIRPKAGEKVRTEREKQYLRG